MLDLMTPGADHTLFPSPATGGATRPGPGARLRRLLSPRCLLCATAAGDPLCTGCNDSFFPANVHRCRVCAQRLGPASGDLCGACLRHPPAFDTTLALADYATPVDGVVVGLKFGHRLDLAHALGRLLGAAIARALPPAALVPVPLAHERQRSRGFNQAREIALVAARIAGRPLLTDVLARAHHRAPQEGLDLDARRRNVRGAFVVPAAAQPRLAGQAVIVVDDVMTSGSTLDEVARVLKRAGAAQVFNAIVARTP